MFARLLVQAILTLTVIEMVPMDASTLERSAKLPTAAPRSSIMTALQLASYEDPALPQAGSRGPVKTDEQSLGIVTTAQSVYVIDRETGSVLFQKNPDATRPIGSITKLMTALVFLDGHPNLDTAAVVIEDDYRAGGRSYLAYNDPVTGRDLLQAGLVGSDNTAITALVRLSGKTQEVFVEEMNVRTEALGMHATRFVDPTGLSADNISTAMDITRLLDAALREPEIHATTTMPEAVITQESGRTVTIPSTDELLNSFVNEAPYDVLGGKTGYLPQAGYCMAVGVDHEGAGEVLVVLLGSESKISRVQEIKGLAAWVYRVFSWE